MSDKKPTPPQEKKKDKSEPKPEKEFGGYEDLGKPEPTRYGDWESGGRCTDF